MSDLATELIALAEGLSRYAAPADSDDFEGPLSAIEEAAQIISKASSGSWLGYQANVYFATLEPPPPGMHFSSEWGLLRSSEGWQEFDADALEQGIRELAGSPDMTPVKAVADRAKAAFEDAKAEATSLLLSAQEEKNDSFISRLQKQLEALKIHSAAKIVRAIRPSGRGYTRDSLAVSQGIWTPPHIVVLAEAMSFRQPVEACRELSNLCRRGGSHLRRRYTLKSNVEGSSREKDNVFVIHGRDEAKWRELNDLIQSEFHLNPIVLSQQSDAGCRTIIEKFEHYAETCSYAIAVFTPDDEVVSDSEQYLQARPNVIYELGWFCGRLGRDNVMLLLKEGTSMFSDFGGIIQKRFARNVTEKLVEIRQDLMAAGVLPDV